MKIAVCFGIWMFITLLLVLSVVGIIVLLPKANFTDYYKTQEELRSTWMRLGYDLKDKLIRG